MIDRVLVRKYVDASTFLFFGLAIALFAFAWVRVWVVSLLDMSQFSTVLDQFREFERFAPIEFDSILTYVGRVGMTYDEPVVILCTVIWCFARGSDVVAGELNRGTLEMLLSQPIRRTTLLFSHAVVSIVGLALLNLLVWAGIAVGVRFTSVEETVRSPTFRIPVVNVDIPLTTADPETVTVPLSERVDPTTFAASTFNLFAFGFFLLALATLFSSIERYRWRAIGMTVAVYVIQLVMYGLGKASESLSWLLSTTFFSCYKPQKMTLIADRHGGDAVWRFADSPLPDLSPPMWYPMTLIALGLVAYGCAAWIFAKRDLPAPV